MPAPPPADYPDDDDLTEEQREAKALMLDIDNKTGESLDSTRRMVQMCEESKEAGIRTLVNLDEQGEQLEKIENAMSSINQDMRTAEKNLEGMEKCCGLCVLPWKRTKNPAADFDKAWKEENNNGADGPRVQMGDGPMFGGNIVTRITNDDREEEMENNLVEVGTMVGNLRNMAVDMSGEVENQNTILDKNNKRAIMNEARISEANKRAMKLL